MNLETAVARLNRLDIASQWGHGWLAQATRLSMKPILALCELPVSRVPIGGLFQNFSLTLRVTQCFLVLAKKSTICVYFVSLALFNCRF